MLEMIFYNILFFGIPAALLILLSVCIRRYHAAVEENEKAPGTHSPEEIKRRKVMLILATVAGFVPLAVAIGFVALFFMAIAFM